MNKFFSLNIFQALKRPIQTVKQFFLWFCIGIIALGLISFLLSEKKHGWVELPESGENMRFYSNQTGDDLDRILKKAIYEAKNSIYIEIFNLSEPSVLEILNKKASEGLEIHVVVEGKYYNKLRRQLKGVIRMSQGTTHGGLMHRKVLVIDGQQAWLGSANFTWESLKTDSNLVAGVCSRELSNLLVDPSYPSHGQLKIAGQAIEIWNIPEATAPVEKLIESLERATSHIRIAMFTWTRLDLAEAVVRAKKRGVDVSIVLDKRSIEGASETVFDHLKKAGVTIRVNNHKAIMHHKFLWIDDTKLYFGSVNWTEGGFRRNRDVLVYIPILTLSQERFMQNLWDSLWIGSKSP